VLDLVDASACAPGGRLSVARLSALGVDFQHWCFACGRLNPAGMHLDVDVTRSGAETRYVGQQQHQGYDGTLHGGVVAALLDETMGWAIFHQGIWGVTAKLDVKYRRPVPVGEELRVTAEVVRDRGRGIELHGTVARASDGEVLAEADGLFLRMPEERKAQLERRYSSARDAFEKVRAAVAAEERASEDPALPVRSELRKSGAASRERAGGEPTAIGREEGARS
jgi:uncharacterized protein (TIGR00369 family)